MLIYPTLNTIPKQLYVSKFLPLSLLTMTSIGSVTTFSEGDKDGKKKCLHLVSKDAYFLRKTIRGLGIHNHRTLKRTINLRQIWGGECVMNPLAWLKNASNLNMSDSTRVTKLNMGPNFGKV